MDGKEKIMSKIAIYKETNDNFNYIIVDEEKKEILGHVNIPKDFPIITKIETIKKIYYDNGRVEEILIEEEYSKY